MNQLKNQKASNLILKLGTANTGKTYSSVRYLEARLGIENEDPEITSHQPNLSQPPILRQFADGKQVFLKQIILFDPHGFFEEIWSYWPYSWNEYRADVPFCVFDDMDDFASIMMRKDPDNSRKFLIEYAIVIVDELQYLSKKNYDKLKKAMIGRRHRNLEFLVHSWRPSNIPVEVWAGLKRAEVYRIRSYNDAVKVRNELGEEYNERKTMKLQLRCGDCIVEYVGTDPYFDCQD